MKRVLLAAMVAALSLPTVESYAAPAGNMVVAQRDRDWRGNRHGNWNDNWRGNWSDDHRTPDAWTQRHPSAVVGRPHWSRGDRLYRYYWGPNYYVDDWRRYHLRHPPRGYRWVRVDDDFLLVAIASGIIFDILRSQDMDRR